MVAMKQIRENEDLKYKLMIDNMFEGFAYSKVILNQGEPVDYIFMEVNQAFERMLCMVIIDNTEKMFCCADQYLRFLDSLPI
jgi:hypothetical protein